LCPTLTPPPPSGRLPENMRRNYGNVFRGMYVMARDEGFKTLFRGGGVLVLRGMLMTAGQLTSYDVIKALILEKTRAKDDIRTHIAASAAASFVAVVVTWCRGDGGGC
jgi:hypothetical protein